MLEQDLTLDFKIKTKKWNDFFYPKNFFYIESKFRF